MAAEICCTNLAWLEEVKANVGVTCGWIHAVMTEVLTDVFWRGLGQDTVYTFPKAKRKTIK